jgi:acetyl esterase/lipase
MNKSISVINISHIQKTMKEHFNTLTLLIFIFFIGVTGFSQAQNETLPLWQNEIPSAIKSEEYKEVEVFENGIVRDVSKVTTPTLSVFVPEKPNGTAMVICPGGGYAYLAINKEGFKVAKWLNTLGITAFVLKYRLPSDEIMKDKTIGALQDAQESIRYVRRNAVKWNLNVDKIGIMGFSAGGHLASTLSTRFNDEIYKVTDNSSARPDFSVLVYPVISMEENLTHKGSRTNLLGATPSIEIIEKYSNQKNINATTPPTLLIHAIDDKSVPVENSMEYFLALEKNNIPSEMHLYQNGKHGFGLGNKGTTSQNWTKQCEDWLRANNYLVEASIEKKNPNK